MLMTSSTLTSAVTLALSMALANADTFGLRCVGGFDTSLMAASHPLSRGIDEAGEQQLVALLHQLNAHRAGKEHLAHYEREHLFRCAVALQDFGSLLGRDGD